MDIDKRKLLIFGGVGAGLGLLFLLKGKSSATNSMDTGISAANGTNPIYYYVPQNATAPEQSVGVSDPASVDGYVPSTNPYSNTQPAPAPAPVVQTSTPTPVATPTPVQSGSGLAPVRKPGSTSADILPAQSLPVPVTPQHIGTAPAAAHEAQIAAQPAHEISSALSMGSSVGTALSMVDSTTFIPAPTSAQHSQAPTHRTHKSASGGIAGNTRLTGKAFAS